jgi:cytochrome c biogenesis protein ResB
MEEAITGIWKGVMRVLGSLGLFLLLSVVLVLVLIAGAALPDAHIYSSPWFVVLLALIGFNLAVCTVEKRERIGWGVLLTHLGVLIVLAGATLTWQGGRRGQMSLQVGEEPTNQVRSVRGGETWHLPFSVQLEEFKLEYEGQDVHRMKLRHRESGWSGELEVTPQGRFEVPQAGGILATGFFNPDLVVGSGGVTHRSIHPNNPALQVGWIANEKLHRYVWVFAKHADVHTWDLPVEVVEYEYKPAPLKQYVSKILIRNADGHLIDDGYEPREFVLWVNKPLRHEGWTLYQSGYDPATGQVSIIEVSKDPGVGTVYIGFVVLMLGLVIVVTRRKT